MISGARRPRARCAVSDRRLAEATAARRLLPRTERGSAGWAQPSAMARSLRRIARMDAPLGPPSVTSRKRRSPAARGSGQPKHLRVGKAKSVREWAKLPSPARRKKRRRRSPCDASRQIYFIAWVVCAREIDDLNVFGCDRSGRGIDFLAASGFNDVSSTGILTYS